jgi:hypothetical protein
MEGYRLVHYEQRLSALLFMHAQMGQGKQVLHADKRRIQAAAEVTRSCIKKATTFHQEIS